LKFIIDIFIILLMIENFAFPPFGTVNLNSLEDNYTAQIEVNGVTVNLDLYFEFTDMDKCQANAVKKFIDYIPRIDTQNRTYIDKEYGNVEGEIVKEYLIYHLDELDEEDLYELLDFEDKAIDPEIQLYHKLELCGVALHSEPGDILGFNTFFKYTVCPELSDCVIVVDTDGFGKAKRLYWD
jgi:hypothetical protein